MNSLLLRGGLAMVFMLTLSPALAQPNRGAMGEAEPGTCPICEMTKKAGVCPMSHMMIKSMTETALVATSDGGVVVLKGNRLTKYDRELTVVKSTEITVDVEGMQRGMRQMMKACPMKGVADPADTVSDGKEK